jgi:flagellar hook-length control protein FliK
MDSSKISQFFGLTPRLGNAAGNTDTGKGGFAELMFGIMNKRTSTLQQPVVPSRTSPYLANDRTIAAVTGPAGKSGTAPVDGGLARCGPGPDNRNGAAPVTVDRAQACGTATAGGKDRNSRATEGTTASAAEEATPADAGADVRTEGETSEVDETTPTEGEESQAADSDPFGAGHGADTSDSGERAAPLTPPLTPSQPGTAATPVVAPATPAGTAAPIAAVPEAEGLPAASPLDLGNDLAADPLPEPEVAAADGGTPDSDQGEDAAPNPIAAAPRAGGRTASPEGATQSALPVDSWQDAAAQSGLLMRRGERAGEDQAAMFRQSQQGIQQGPQQGARQRAAAAGQGAAGNAVAHAAVQTGASATPAGAANPSHGTPVPAGQGPSTLLPPGGFAFDPAFGQASGLPGWQLHLAQGAASRRADFVANLRQHLQNLPTHEQVALGIQRAARDGGGRITLQLSPAELGRIHVKLEIDRENNARASVSVERPATLEVLQRDSRALERALQEAGLKMDRNDLSFSLHGGDGDSFAQAFGDDGGRLPAGGSGSQGEGEDEMIPPAGRMDVLATGDGIVDVQI